MTENQELEKIQEVQALIEGFKKEHGEIDLSQVVDSKKEAPWTWSQYFEVWATRKIDSLQKTKEGMKDAHSAQWLTTEPDEETNKKIREQAETILDFLIKKKQEEQKG